MFLVSVAGEAKVEQQAVAQSRFRDGFFNFLAYFSITFSGIVGVFLADTFLLRKLPDNARYLLWVVSWLLVVGLCFVLAWVAGKTFASVRKLIPQKQPAAGPSGVEQIKPRLEEHSEIRFKASTDKDQLFILWRQQRELKESMRLLNKEIARMMAWITGLFWLTVLFWLFAVIVVMKFL